MTDPTEVHGARQSTRRVQAVVALRLLEVLRDRDLPGEFLKDEDPTRTMPRRFGLSDVVERQIRTYRASARKGVRLSEEEVGDLFRLVIRRPDGDEVFKQLGMLLATPDRSRPWIRFVPKRGQFAFARSLARRKLRKLFGRSVGGFARGSFVIEGRSLLFIRSDPGGDACHLLSGFCQEVIDRNVRGTVRVDHALCESRGDELCRWQAEIVETSPNAAEPSGSQEAEAEA